MPFELSHYRSQILRLDGEEYHVATLHHPPIVAYRFHAVFLLKALAANLTNIANKDRVRRAQSFIQNGREHRLPHIPPTYK
jgi:hypothetical protein